MMFPVPKVVDNVERSAHLLPRNFVMILKNLIYINRERPHSGLNGRMIKSLLQDVDGDNIVKREMKSIVDRQLDLP